MKSRLLFGIVVVSLLAGLSVAQGKRQRLNPMIDLLEQKKPVFGLYMPREMTADAAKMAVGKRNIDYIFSGGAPQGFPEFVKGLSAAGVLQNNRLSHPIMLKIHKIAEDPARALTETSEQLNLGTNGQMFVEVESAKEVQQGLSMMRLKSKGGQRPDNVGSAPAYWGMTEQQYRQKADVWPLNPEGELVNWTIIETKEGLKNARAIAAVKGIGVLWPGAGTLGGVFTVTKTDGTRANDPVAWEAAIQTVLAACKEFNVACGYPAGAQEKTADGLTNPGYIEFRMKQGFTVFVMQSFDENAFKAVEIGRRASGRPATNN